MSKLWSLKLNHRGASLIAVLVTIAVVGVMGIIISEVTITNIQMKEVERQSKTNFYDAEQALDDITAGLNKIAAQAMEKAYTDMLGQYRKVTADGSDPKDIFSRNYLNNMIEEMNTTDASKQEYSQKKVSDEGTETTVYARGYYSLSKLCSAFIGAAADSGIAYTTDEAQAILTVEADGDSIAWFKADYTNKLFILEGVQVSVKDEIGNMVTIGTDLVFHTPEITLDGSNVLKEFMRYSLIANDKIDVNASGVLADGNVYAGIGGIYAGVNDQAKFVGRKIVTRGDIVASSKGTLIVGSDSASNAHGYTYSQIWARNVKTERIAEYEATSENHATLTLNGYSFISDDLEMNGAYDEVYLNGEYNGYNFQENYDGSSRPNNAAYSSSVVINGRESNLVMVPHTDSQGLSAPGVTSLTIAGRTYISRKAGFTEDGKTNALDIAMGEGLAVRTNQIAYYVPETCVNKATKEINETAYQNYSGITNVKSYLNSAANVTEFQYRYLTSTPETIYYLNFASDQKANDFYKVYYAAKGNVLNTYAEKYLQDNALKLNQDISLTLRGDILYRRNDNNALSVYQTTIDPAYWDPGTTYFNYAKNKAIQYKSLQTNLEDKNSSITAADVRFVDTAENGMFRTLIDYTGDPANPGAFETLTASAEDGKIIREWQDTRAENPIPGKKLIAIVNGDYTVSGYNGGLVVASGNVVVATNFKGTIISGGTISFTNNASVDSDELLISQMINEDILLQHPAFATIFRGYAEAADAEMHESTISRFLTFENWTKTIEN